MKSQIQRFSLAIAVAGLAAILPVTARALLPPMYLLQWGSQGSGAGQFIGMNGVATDPAGNVYVTDAGNDRVEKFTATGAFITQWGSNGTGNGQFIGPFGVAADAAGDVYVVDQINHRIQKFTGTGAYVTQWGSFGSGDGQFKYPYGVAIDASGNVYVLDGDSSPNNSRIQKFTGSGTYISQWGGAIGSGNGQFWGARGIAVDPAGDVYVTDHNRVQKFTNTGTYLTQWGSSGSGDGQFLNVFGLATDGTGNIYVTDSNNPNPRVQKFTGSGTYVTKWGASGSGNGQFGGTLYAVASDAVGNVYVADYQHYRIQKFGEAPVPVRQVTWSEIKAALGGN